MGSALALALATSRLRSKYSCGSKPDGYDVEKFDLIRSKKVPFKPHLVELIDFEMPADFNQAKTSP